MQGLAGKCRAAHFDHGNLTGSDFRQRINVAEVTEDSLAPLLPIQQSYRPSCRLER